MGADSSAKVGSIRFGRIRRRTTALQKTPLNRNGRDWDTVAHAEKTLAVRSERSRASGEVEVRGFSLGTLAFDFAALRSGRTETTPPTSEAVYESHAV